MKFTYLLVLGVVSLSAFAAEPPAWLDQLQISGDFRGRLEPTDYDAREDRQRYRIRLRVNAIWRLDDNWAVGTRVVTGNPDDARSTHQTLDDEFADFDVSLDRAYLQYSTGPVKAWFGKFANPFKAHAVYNELSWDGDLQPEGAAASYQGDYFHAAAGYYVIDERSGQSDARSLAAQIGGQSKGAAHTSWALAYYSFDELEGQDAAVALTEAQLGVHFPLGSARGRAVLQYMHNPDATTDQDTGTVLGLELKSDGFFSRYYLQYQRIEAEAVLPFLAQDDFTASSNFKGFVAGLNYPLRKKIDLHAWVLTADPLVGDGGVDVRYRLDINARF